MKHSSGGFTLIELLVTLVIVVILLVIAAPSYNGVISTNRVAAEANSLVGDLQFARSAAVKEGASVTICPPNVGGLACITSTTWTNGWIVIDAAGTILRVQKPITSTDTLISPNGLAGVTFSYLGVSSATGSVAVTPTSGSAQQVCVYLVGQVKAIAGGAAC
jgi:type IV fimbrial biogenesis protein FimT